MKYLFLILLIITSILKVDGQTNTFPTTGNAGIGTLSPQGNLDFFRTFGAGQTKVLKMFYQGSWNFASYASDFRFLDIESTEGSKILQLNGYGMGIGFEPPGYASPDKLYINGNVGIGTTTPIAKIQAGSFDNNKPAPYFYNYSNAISKGLLIEGGNSSADYSANISNRLGTSLLYVRGDGNVGIGTSTPNTKLAVNGNIRAHSIKVETANWPDYVFLPSYKVPSLQETEKHIKENGHLPGIPSASEVHKNGVDLGGMNAKLLQKIEELTLHLIRQEKEIELLKSRLTLQRTKDFKATNNQVMINKITNINI